MKRIVTIGVVTGALILGAVAGWAVAGFTDVPEDSPHAPAIEWAVDLGIIGGKTATTFDPSGRLTRAQMVTILHRYHNAFPEKVKVIDYTEPDLVLSGNGGDVTLQVGTDIQPGVYSVEYTSASPTTIRQCTMYRYSGFQYTGDQVIWSREFRPSGRTVLEILSQAIREGDVRERLEGEPLEPVFRRA